MRPKTVLDYLRLLYFLTEENYVCHHKSSLDIESHICSAVYPTGTCTSPLTNSATLLPLSLFFNGYAVSGLP